MFKKLIENRITHIIIIALLAVILLVMLILFFMRNGALPSLGNTNMVFELADETMAYSIDSPKLYTTKDTKGFFLATRDDIRFVTPDGKETRLGTYNLTAPELVGKGDVVGVASNGGTTLHIFKPQGALYTVTTENPISFFSVTENAYAVVIARNGENYDIIVYNNKGKDISYTLYAEPNISPIAADVSSDGRILAVSYLDRNGGEINTKVTFSYTNKAEAADFTAENGVFAAVTPDPDTIIGILRFMKGNTLIALSDRNLMCYEVGDKAVLKWSIDLGNKLSAICLSESDWFALAYGARNPNIPGEEPGVCRFYDLNGSALGEYRVTGQISQLTLGAGAALVTGDRRLTAISQNGNLLWTYDAPSDTLQAAFFENTNQIVLVGSAQTQILRRVKLAPASADPAASPIESAEPLDSAAPLESAEPTDSAAPAESSAPTSTEEE